MKIEYLTIRRFGCIGDKPVDVQFENHRHCDLAEKSILDGVYAGIENEERDVSRHRADGLSRELDSRKFGGEREKAVESEQGRERRVGKNPSP